MGGSVPMFSLDKYQSNHYITIMEIRQNKLTGEWIIISPERGKRPGDFKKKGIEDKKIPEYDKDCPFCDGNEKYLIHPFIMETQGVNENPWQTRVLLNKYPALTPEKDVSRSKKGIYLTMPAYGHHEVIIDHPKHNMCIGLMQEEEIRAVIETYWRRYTKLMEDERNLMIIIFQNHGVQAGTSLVHPHSQLIATGIVPSHLRVREEESLRYFDDFGRCVMCDILNYENKNRERMLFENDSFLSFIPFAAEVPFEIWIVPRKHNASFGDICEEERDKLASIFRKVMHLLYERLNDPDYNYMILSATRYAAFEPHIHWYLRIRPRLTTQAGFEIGSGISINPSLPEENAEFLRSELNR